MKVSINSSQDYCDIIIPVFNGLNYLKSCLASIVKYTDYPHRILLVDNGSDNKTEAFIRSFAENHSGVFIIRNEENTGFVKAVNQGMRCAKGRFKLILNTDVIVTPRWLRKMIRCAESDPSIAVVNPLSNSAANLTMPIATGANAFIMNERIERFSRRIYPDIVTAVGFCFLVTKKAFEEVGFFDEIYGMGYGEESDYSLRCVKKGFRVVAADDTYVYHKGEGTAVDREKQYLRNRIIFHKRWGKEYEELLAKFNQDNRLGYLIELLHLKRRFSLYETIKRLFIEGLNYIRAQGLRGILGRFREYIRGDNLVYKADLKKIDFAGIGNKDALSVVYLLPSVDLEGGVLEVIQIANELILEGVDVKIITFTHVKNRKYFNIYTEPIVCHKLSELLGNFPKADIVVATAWTTAYWLRDIAKKYKDFTPCYFIQGLESNFYRKGDHRREQVLLSYDFIENKIVISDWLNAQLSSLGYKAHKINNGIDLDIFYPRLRGDTRCVRILSPARPFEEWRGFREAVKVLELLKKQYRNAIEIVFFGKDKIKDLKIPFEYISAGPLYEPNRLAELYSSCDIFVELSHTHGFGRCGLEAMACGVPCVLSSLGGVNEYAISDRNALMFSPFDTEGNYSAISRLIDDAALRRRLAQEGIVTAANFSHKKEAKLTLEFFMQKLSGKRLRK